MTAKQCIRAAQLLEQRAQELMASHAYAGHWVLGCEKEKREHAEHRELAGALRAMAARYYAASEGNKR